MAGLDDPGDTGGWRVFLSHTSELREFPRGMSYVAAAEQAVSAAGHVIVDMADFPAADQPAAQLCAERVRGCDLYVAVLGTRYGSQVRDMPEVSYTELEFDAATEAGLDRLVFLLDTDADDLRIPASQLIDREFGSRQDAFRRRVRDSGLVTQSFASPAKLGQLVERSLRDLAQARRGTGGGSGRAAEEPVEENSTEKRYRDLFADLIAHGHSMISRLQRMVGLSYPQLLAIPAEEQVASLEYQEWKTEITQRVHDVFNGKADARLELQDKLWEDELRRHEGDEVTRILNYCRRVVSILQEFEEI